VAERTRSTLHLQMGQETLYLLLISAFFALVLLAAKAAAGLHAEQHRATHSDEQPLVTLPEAEGFTFEPGKSAISANFAQLMIDKHVVPNLVTRAREAGVNVVEVIGNTDEVPLQNSKRMADNLDATLIPLVNGHSIGEPVAADNVGLGMARAVEVARELRVLGLPADFKIVPLSAGAFAMPDNKIADGTDTGPDANRRRIVLRLRPDAPAG
jgi:flagellar motor protein MotB